MAGAGEAWSTKSRGMAWMMVEVGEAWWRKSQGMASTMVEAGEAWSKKSQGKECWMVEVEEAEWSIPASWKKASTLGSQVPLSWASQGCCSPRKGC